MGENASFTCRARGTNITIYWEIDEDEYRDCGNQDFCVNTTPGDRSISSVLTINTTQLRDTAVHCVVEQVFGEQANSSSSTGQLIVRAPPLSPPPSTSKTHKYAINTCMFY